MAVKTKHTFSAANGSTAAFSGHGIELNNLDDLDVYVTLSGGTRVLQLRQASGSTAQSSHPQVNNTDGLYFPAVSAGTTLYNYQLSTANDTITFNSNLPNLAVVTVERRTRDGSGDYTTFAGGSTVRHTDLNRSATESNYTAQEGRNKAFELEGKIFGDAATGSSFITSDDIVDGTIVAADLASNSVTTAKIQDNAVTADKLAHTSVSAGSYTAADITVDAQGRVTSAASGTIGASEISSDAINGDKIADNSINSEHYVDGSIDTAHLADSSVTDAKLAAGAIGTNGLANGAVTTVKLAADAVNGDKIADNSINSEHYVDGSIDTIHIGDNQINTAKLADNSVQTANILDNNVTLAKLGSGALPTDITVNANNLVANSVGTSEIATDAVNGTKIADNAIDSEHYTDGSIDTAHIGNLQVTTGKIAADAIDGTKLADNAVGTEHIAANAVTTSEIADAELTTLAGMQSGTASNLASSTALTSTNAELNLLDGKSIVTAVSGSSTDVQLPTAKAVNDQIVNTISDVGGFVPVANEVSFPNTNPDPGNNAGTIVSIADAGGIVVNGSGVSTTGRTLGGATVTINGIDSTLYSTTIAAGKGMLVQTTSTLNTYTYHRLVVDEAGVAAAQTLVSDFNQRYRVGASNPSSSLDDGDLFFNTSSDKMLVYNATASAWEEVQSVGNYFINTISSYSGTGGNNATFNGTAYRFVLSNAGTYAEQHIVSINGVVQKPNSGTSQPSEGFAIDGSSIIFSAAPATGSDFFIITVGASVNIGTPSNNTVSTAIIQNLAVTGDKIATNLDLADNKKIRFGTGSDLQIYHDGTDDRIMSGSTNSLIIGTKYGRIMNAAGNETQAKFFENGSVELYYDNSKKLETTSTGVLSALHIQSGPNGSFYCGNNAGVLSGEFANWDSAKKAIKIGADPANDTANSFISLQVDGAEQFQIDNGALTGADNKKIKLGTGDDLQLYHDGSNSYLKNSNGALLLRGAGGSDHLHLEPKDNENGIIVKPDSGVDLYYDNVKKFWTNSWGCSIAGALNLTGDIEGTQDNLKLLLGSSNDLQIYHNGSVNFIDSPSHEIRIRGTYVALQPNGGGAQMALGTAGGAFELFYDGSKKFDTNAGGAQCYGNLIFQDNYAAYFGNAYDLRIGHDGSNSYIDDHGTGSLRIREGGNNQWEFSGSVFKGNDGRQIILGDSSDLQIYHDGSNSYLHNNTGRLRFEADDGGFGFFKGSGAETLAFFNLDAECSLYYDGSKKFETTSGGITVTGSVTTNDINLSNLNAPLPNEVDSTRGSWTMQEGADDLFLINRSNGKKYKFNLTEVS